MWIRFQSILGRRNRFHYDLFDKIDPKLSKVIQDKVSAPVVNIGEVVGKLDDKMAQKLGLSKETMVSPFIIDAHASLLGIGSEKR